MSIATGYTTTDHADLDAWGVSAASAPEPLGKVRIAEYARATRWEQKHLPAFRFPEGVL
ncbi:hypothetical protein [Rhodococcus jostii]|uniref:hypothetical protein n=1 Tax=Rhodococcus jostii TaxID=132919 RepID=UPI0036450558